MTHLCCEWSVEIFRQINYLVISLVSKNDIYFHEIFAQKRVREVQCCDILQIICKNFREISLREMQLDLKKNDRHLKYTHLLSKNNLGCA